MSERLERLEKRRAQLDARIQRRRALERKGKRKRDTRRKILIGAIVLAEEWDGWQEGDPLPAGWRDRLDRALDRDHDRSVFGLPPRPSHPPESEPRR